MEPPKLRHCPKFLGLAGAASLRLSKVSANVLSLRSEGGVNSTIDMSRSRDCSSRPLRNLRNENPNLRREPHLHRNEQTDIRRMFEPFGGKSRAADVFTAGKKRFAFVLMMNESDAESAIGGLNGSEFFGRELLVQWTAKQRSVRSDDFMPNREPSPHDRTWYNALVNRVL